LREIFNSCPFAVPIRGPYSRPFAVRFTYLGIWARDYALYL
jgi:hypothetical protein